MLNNLSIGRKLALIAVVPFFFFLLFAFTSSDGGGALKILLPLLSLLSGLGLAFLFSRDLRDSLAELRDEAESVANSDLPRLADALSTGVPVAALASDREPLDMGESEFGEVAASLASVRNSASAVGERVSVLQGGIAETFVNLARRNQSLVDRQLEAIDTLEAEERDSDRLSLLYRVDHLATRMRRNAESLLVLADAKAPERHSPAVELREVLRVAIGEVEDYRRIIPISLDDLHVAGPKAQDLAHLLAELMENAAQHSPPGTAVDVTGAFAGQTGGYVITILDHGTGVDGAQLIELNELLQRPPTSTLTISHSIGLQVVSRLAHSLKVQVSLNHAPEQGLVALVTIPAQVVSEWAQTAPQGSGSGAAPAPAAMPAPMTPPPSAAPAPAMPAAMPLPEAIPDLALPEFGAPGAEVPAAEAPVFGSFNATGPDADIGSSELDADLGLVMPEAPATPTIDMPELELPSLGAVEVPEIPAMPDVAPESPGMQLPSLDMSAADLALPGLTDPNYVPEVTAIPDHSPSAPALPEVPEFGLPEAPAFDAPEVPEFGLPEAPAFDAPEVPEFGLPEAPAFDAPEVPEFGLPEAPAFETAPAFEAPAVFDPADSIEPAAAEVFEAAPLTEPFEEASPATPPFGAPEAPQQATPLELVPDMPVEPVAPLSPVAEAPAFDPAPAPAFDPAPAPAFDPAPAPAPIVQPVDPAPAAFVPIPQPQPAAAQPQPAAAQPQPAAAQPAPVAEPVAPATTSSGLKKRTRATAAAIPQADLTADRTAPSQRTPDQVKNMLSRYKTGLERGRGPAETDGEV